MKNSNYEYCARTDINEIVCDVHSVDLYIIPTHEKRLKVLSANAKRLHVSIDGNSLKITQGNCNPLFVHRKKRIEILVPESTVPGITIDGKHAAINVSGGIYDKFTVSCDDCTVKCEHASFSECTFTGATLSTLLSGVTVKESLVVKCGEGDMIWENSFASRTECRVKRGNIGLSDFNCKDSIMSAEKGNVAARLNGAESDYSLGLIIKEGTANRESVIREGAPRSFKAYSARGSIAIDFVHEDEITVYGNN